jgi:hypothetical protein
MRWLQNNRERQRYYLLPGMGEGSVRRKRRMMLWWGITTGLIISAILAAMLYIFNRK